MNVAAPPGLLEQARRSALRTGGMIADPIRTLRAIASEGASPAVPLALFVVVTLLIELKVLGRLALLLDDGGTVILRRLRDALLEPTRTDLLLLVITAFVAAGLTNLLAKGRVPARNVAVAATWLLVPLVVMKAVGGALQAFQVDLWWLPHHAVDSWVVLVNRQVSWLRFAAKCATAYGLPLALAVTLVWGVRASGETTPSAAPSTRRSLVGLVVVVSVLLTLAGGAVWSAARLADRIRPTITGDVLPDATLRRLDEFGVQREKLKISTLLGKVVVLDFWASWCAPCRRSMPELSALSDELKSRGLVVVGINREPSDPQAARKAVGEMRPTFDCVIDERGYGDRLGLTTLPTSYIVDKKGVVRHLHLGYTEPAVLRAEIEALLSE